MKNKLVLIIGAMALLPHVASAGFSVDPALERALALPPATPLNVASLPSASAPGVGQPMATAVATAASVPTAIVSTTTLGVPSDAWGEKIDGFGSNQPARQALAHLVPSGGKLIVNAAISPTARVSWKGNDSRLAIARKILADAGIDGRFDGDNLVIGAAPAAFVVPAVTPQDPAVESRLWTMAKGVMLSDGLADWMEQTAAAGERYRWTLDWAAFDGVNAERRVDYRIVAPLRFNGTIDQAVAQLVMLYKKSTKPLEVKISKEQRLIHIKLRGAN
ncbi:TcpQ domain-containing protein [Burkholderia arboris]|uniref:TcpQ domain-containing protein n=1 Tax=Burkholderia arboris TaxID=488730 RepID=UPI001CF59850|nr:TcpQ domain-containing protein [Burkholderia arboris]MCA8050680.1 TcpQ domain-containing protein [Burkholderia arboris]